MAKFVNRTKVSGHAVVAAHAKKTKQKNITKNKLNDCDSKYHTLLINLSNEDVFWIKTKFDIANKRLFISGECIEIQILLPWFLMSKSKLTQIPFWALTN